MVHSILVPMLAGFAVFMLGMKMMELALHRSAGKHLDHILKRSTATPIHGMVVGTATTAVLQSSTAVTVMSIGLVNAGLLTFPRTLGIVLGTNIGTCLTTELIGLNISSFALPMLELSLCVWVITVLIGETGLLPALPSRRRSAVRLGAAGGSPSLQAGSWLLPVRNAAVIVGGFSLLLVGMKMMQSVSPAVQASGLFSLFLTKAESSVLWGLAAGIVLTAAVHSSAAVIAIIMGFAAAGVMPVPIGIAVVIGANIGTCVTAVLASLGGTKSGQYVAWAHVALNVGGAVLFAPLVGQLHDMMQWLTDSPAAQIAHAQTIFNIAGSLLALPLCYLPALQRLTPR